MELDNAALLELAKAQVDANRLKQDELNLERRRQAIPLQIIEAAATLSQDFRQLMTEVRQDRKTYKGQFEWIDKIYEDLADRMDRLEHLIGLILIEGSKQEKKDAQQVLDNENSIRRQLKKRYRNLNKLDEQAAGYGMDIPIQLLNAIEEEKAAIVDLEEKL